MNHKALTLAAALVITPAAHAAVIAETNFDSATKSSASETMTGIVWTGDDLVNVTPGTSASYTLLDSDAGFDPAGFFTTGYGKEAFAPALNVQNTGDWAATFQFDLAAGATGTLTSISFGYQGLTNAGANQGGGRAIPMNVTVNGTAFDATLSTSTISSGGTLSFTDSEALISGTNTIVISTDAYENKDGWNIGIDNLSFAGTIQVIPEPSVVPLLGTLGVLMLLRRRRDA
ncbi:PEP-CTERM sorting domain-containing protein [Haloferula sp. A504]|uniref:PEP-CTERM sorting domain-containing protein n=1 Tax=Haloferula sp. A504 TaxID=3373601 RepID=UPI0031C1DD50|nr:PEP-CTERM sorting domain-containing protein [Verrucomicrobiaceae bacterium E54]